MNREELLKKYADPIHVLDHGFVQLVDVMGDDAAVLQAARTSTGASSRGEEADRALLRYLFRHRHDTPFEAANIKLVIRLPIFVERQMVRHRASWTNEVSARYTTLPEEFYLPPVSRVQRQSASNKQGSGDHIGELQAFKFRGDYEANMSSAFNLYSQWSEHGDAAKELARINLPVGTYTQKMWGTSLRMLLHFLTLRVDPHAQWEIRQYANVIAGILEDWAPWTYEAWQDYEVNAHTFSAQEMALLVSLVDKGIDAVMGSTGLAGTPLKALADRFGIGSVRERKEFWSALGVLED